MTQAIYSVSSEGKLKNIGRDFPSYDYDTVEKCAGLFLGASRKYALRTRKLGGSKSDFEWNLNSVTLYAARTPSAHEAVLRLMRIGGVDSLAGYCFAVTKFSENDTELRGVFDSREALEAFVASVDQDTADNLYVRIVPLNEVL